MDVIYMNQSQQLSALNTVLSTYPCFMVYDDCLFDESFTIGTCLKTNTAKTVPFVMAMTITSPYVLLRMAYSLYREKYSVHSL